MYECYISKYIWCFQIGSLCLINVQLEEFLIAHNSTFSFLENVTGVFACFHFLFEIFLVAPRGRWDLSSQTPLPMLEGRVLTTEPPVKSLLSLCLNEDCEGGGRWVQDGGHM